jgi:hypothetical protein
VSRSWAGTLAGADGEVVVFGDSGTVEAFLFLPHSSGLGIEKHTLCVYELKASPDTNVGVNGRQLGGEMFCEIVNGGVESAPSSRIRGIRTQERNLSAFRGDRTFTFRPAP